MAMNLPDGILEQTNLTGTLADIQNDPTAFDSTWMTVNDYTSTTRLWVTFPTPAVPSPLTGIYRFWVQVRKAGGTGTPTVRLDLYINGTISTLGGGAAISPTTPQAAFQEFDFNAIPGVAASDVQILVNCIPSGGGPSARSNLDVASVAWEVPEPSTPPAPPSNVVATPTARDVTVTFDDVTIDVREYNMYRASDNVLLGTYPNSPAVLTGLTSSTLYSIYLTAIGGTTGLESAPSETVPFTTLAFDTLEASASLVATSSLSFPLPKTAELTEDFTNFVNDGSWEQTSGITTYGDHRMLVNRDGATSSDIFSYLPNKFDARGSTSAVELYVRDDHARGPSTYAAYQLRTNPLTPFSFCTIAIFTNTNTLSCQSSDLGESTSVARLSVTYDPVAHRYVRFREDAGTTYFEASPDAVTWTAIYSEASTFDMSSVVPTLQFSGPAASGLQRYEFDNWNTLPSVPDWDDTQPWVDSEPWGAHADGPATVTGTATFAAASSLSSTAELEVPASVPLTATSLLSTSAVTFAVELGAAALAADSSLTAAGALLLEGDANLAASSSLTSAGEVALGGAASLSATSLLSFTAVREALAGTSLEATSSLSTSAEAFSIEVGSVVLAADSSLSASGTLLLEGSASLAATSSMSSSAEVELGGGVALQAASSLSLTAERAAAALVSLNAAASLVATGVAVALVGGDASLQAQAVLEATGTRLLVASVSLLAGSLFTSAGLRVSTGSFPPNIILVQTNLAGDLATIQDDPDASDGSVMTATDPTQVTDLRIGFPTPPGELAAGAGLQTVRVRLRKSATV